MSMNSANTQKLVRKEVRAGDKKKKIPKVTNPKNPQVKTNKEYFIKQIIPDPEIYRHYDKPRKAKI